MQTTHKNTVVSHVSTQSTLCPIVSWNDTEYVLQSQAAVQLLLPFSYEDVIDLPLIELCLSVVFVALTHPRSSY